MQTAIKTANVKKTREELKGRKLIKCPHCRELLMDLDKDDKVDLFCIPARKRKPVCWERTKQCEICGGKVGYNLIKAADSKTAG